MDVNVEVEQYGTAIALDREVAFGVSAWGGPQHGWRIKLRRQDGEVWLLSHLDDEPAGRWVVDARFMANGGPLYVNGFGARYLALAIVTDAFGEALDKTVNTVAIEKART